MPKTLPRISMLREGIHRIQDVAGDYDPLMDLIGDASFVLLGEATHGTHEFYQARAQITQRLIEEKGFNCVAVEADWPDAYRANRFVRGMGADANAIEALGDFKRFPLWMWRNTDVARFLQWLRTHNQGHPPENHVGFYGVDLYSLYASIEAVLQYLQGVDPDMAQQARERYACFDHGAEDPQQYAMGVMTGVRRSCQDEAVEQMIELRHKAAEYLQRDGLVAADEQFFAEQNARVIRNAEEYYREMFNRRANTWNLRDRHMSDTIAALAGHFAGQGREAKIVVWEHNSHIGDARATDAARRGEWNVGQLVRQRHASQSVLIGFTTHHGTVAAASNWDGPVERKKVRPALPESYEALFHDLDIDRFVLPLRDKPAAEQLREPMLERMIGVIYRPETERASHYFYCQMPEQFDAVVHFDKTHAIEPLDPTSQWEEGEVPDTYPFGV